MDATELLPALKNDIDQFVGEAPQFDDITMLSFDYKLKKVEGDMDTKTFSAKILLRSENPCNAPRQKHV